MYDPVNSTRPFVPQLSFSHPSDTTQSRTNDTRYTSFNTVYSSQDGGAQPRSGTTYGAARHSPAPDQDARWARRTDRPDATFDRKPTTTTSSTWVPYAHASTPSGWSRGDCGGGGGRVGDMRASAFRSSASPSTTASARYDAERYVSISPRGDGQGGGWRSSRIDADRDDWERQRVNPTTFAGRAGEPQAWASTTSPRRRRGDDHAADIDGDRYGLRSGIVHSKPRYARRGKQAERDSDTRSGTYSDSHTGSDDASGSYSSSGSYSYSSSSRTHSSTSWSDADSEGRRRRHRRARRGGRRAGRTTSDVPDDRLEHARFGDDDLDLDAQPVIPPELLQRSQQVPFQWNRHPQHPVILSLLQARGIYLPRYRELINYHMSELFLHYLGICCGGSYFVYYAPGKWPKERFFRIRMMPRDRHTSSKSDLIPYLSWTLHQTGVQVVDSIPLEQLVGITATPRAASFRPFLTSPETIIGCREGRGHRARLPVDGAFTLWFYDGQTSASRSVDLLTCDAKVYDVWTKCFRGVVSVNSSSVVQTPLTSTGMSVTMAQLMHVAQRANEEMMAQLNTA